MNAGFGGGGIGQDYSKAFSDNPEAARDIDFKKQVKRKKARRRGEEIIDGVTHDSIGEYMRARDAGVTNPERQSGFLARLRRLFRR